MKRVFFLSIFLIAIVLFGCNKVDYQVLDNDIIQQYIIDNNLTAQPTGSGLYYVIDVPGTGENPTLSSNVTVAYTGSLTDGSIFDQSTVGSIPANSVLIFDVNLIDVD